MEKTNISDLISKAAQVRNNSYSPFSNYRVGAAVLTDSGKIYTGCNVENSSYGLTSCAERNAIFYAASNGERKIRAIAIVGGPKDGDIEYAYPCGACRQVINEFADEETRIYVARTEDDYKEYTVADLLPEGFKL